MRGIPKCMWLYDGVGKKSDWGQWLTSILLSHEVLQEYLYGAVQSKVTLNP